jgi:hypothetical protein
MRRPCVVQERACVLVQTPVVLCSASTLHQVTYFRDLMRDGGAAVGERLAGDEEVLATGRCADITTTGDLDSAGAGWTYVMVTNRHVHWVPSITTVPAVVAGPR